MRTDSKQDTQFSCKKSNDPYSLDCTHLARLMLLDCCFELVNRAVDRLNEDLRSPEKKREMIDTLTQTIRTCEAILSRSLYR